MNTNPPPTPPTLPAANFPVQPFEGPPGFFQVIEAILKQPWKIMHAAHEGSMRVVLLVLAAVIACLAVFGGLLGTFSGGTQYWAAPLKVTGGVLFATLICLPSLYIFSAMSGVEVKIRQVAGILLTVLGLTGLLLVGFAPVVWIFSQSSESVSFMGALALVFWGISLFFGLRLLEMEAARLGLRSGGYLRIWMAIFIFVTLQLTTSLRPIIGTSQDLLPTEKKFFLQHWGEELESGRKDRESSR